MLSKDNETLKEHIIISAGSAVAVQREESGL